VGETEDAGADHGEIGGRGEHAMRVSVTAARCQRFDGTCLNKFTGRFLR